MSYKDNSWFERNEGFISFMGHLAAIEQRNAVIQQLAASNSLQWDIARTQQRIAAQERDQQQRRDTLYDINQAAILIEAHYSDRPEQALYESYCLKHTVDEIGLHHSWFSELEWKNQCTETLNRVLSLINTAFGQLASPQIEDVNRRFEDGLAAKRAALAAKRAEDEARQRHVPCIRCGKPMYQGLAFRRGGVCFRCTRKNDHPWLKLFIVLFFALILLFIFLETL